MLSFDFTPDTTEERIGMPAENVSSDAEHEWSETWEVFACSWKISSHDDEIPSSRYPFSIHDSNELESAAERMKGWDRSFRAEGRQSGFFWRHASTKSIISSEKPCRNKMHQHQFSSTMILIFFHIYPKNQRTNTFLLFLTNRDRNGWMIKDKALNERLNLIWIKSRGGFFH